MQANDITKKRQLKVSFGNIDVQGSFKRSKIIENNDDINHNNSNNNSNNTYHDNINNTPVFATLTSLNPTYPDLKIPFKKEISIGRSRSKNNDIVIKNNDCSSVHCQFQIFKAFNNIHLINIIDLSSNGTFINNTLIGKNNSSLLRDGDRISFASELHYLIKYEPTFKSHIESFFDKYILTDKILGTGHYAQVKEARNKENGQVCAVKIFNSISKINQLSQLNRELEILTDLNHPNIVGFFNTYIESINISNLTTFLVLEKVNGGELFNRIIKKGKLEQFETLEISRQLLQGLSYLHSKDIIHRDLKPENILLNIIPSNDNGKHDPWDDGELYVQVKIADFGLAKFIGNFQFTTTLCGTPSYVAPEILVNSIDRKYNKSVDMWSVGVLIYICLCGFPPFSEELGPPSMRDQILNAKFAFYSPYWDNINDISLDLISKLLVVDPSKRLTVEQAMNHEWFKEKIQDSDYIHSISRISTNSIGYNCEPITLKTRVDTGLTDELIIEKYCTNRGK